MPPFAEKVDVHMSITMTVGSDPNVAPTAWPLRRLSVDQYVRLTETGVFSEDDDMELLDGWMVSKIPKYPRHDATIDLLNLTLTPLLPQGCYFRVQNSLIGDLSVPEPDLLLVRGTPSDYSSRHPRGVDSLLVIEVADSSLERDRLKQAIYAREGIPVYWIVNLTDGLLEVYSDPVKNGPRHVYSTKSMFDENEHAELKLPTVAAVTIPVQSLMA
ncbi:MAG: Uma2 family endonuclease [Planctomycetes bacterium]|nr:Uma2 family endonuclease [Planctomycetota bacterium]